MQILKIAAIGIVGALLALQLKSTKGEFAVYISIGAGILIMWSMSDILGTMIGTLSEIGSMIHVDHIFINIMLKMLGVIYVAEFASGICKDAGYQTLASQIEIFARLTLLGLSLPVIKLLMETIGDFLN